MYAGSFHVAMGGTPPANWLLHHSDAALSVCPVDSQNEAN